MKIIHLSTYDYGGAGLATLRIHNRMLADGYDSTMYVQHSQNKHVNVVIVPSPISFNEVIQYVKNFIKLFVPDSFWEKVKKKLNQEYWMLNAGLLRYSFCNNKESIETGLNLTLVSMIESADILFVPWADGFVNSYDVRKIKEKTGCRVFYYTFDMMHLTGGCHFSWGCDGYMRDCSNCPALDYKNRELASAQMKAKSINIASIKATCLSVLHRDLEKAKKSSIPYANYNILPLAIDNNIFYPSRSERKTNNSEVRYVFENAVIGNIRKGFSYLYQVILILENLLDEDKTIVFLCLDDEPFKSFKYKHIKFKVFNYKTTDKELADIYQMADLFISTSVEDYGPSMLYEALLCGLPSVAFNEGVANEVIENGENGFVVDKYDVKGMANRIYEVLYIPGSITFTPMEIHNKISPRFDKDMWETCLEELLNENLTN